MKWFYLLLIVAFSRPTRAQSHWQKIDIRGFAQGTTYSITYYAQDTLFSDLQADSLFGVVDRSLSIYNDSSLISNFNKSARSVVPDEHLYTVVKRALEISDLTKGKFDITVKPLMDAWGFGKVEPDSLPGKEEINRILQCVGSDLLRLDSGRLEKLKPCVELDPNGIAQGYTVDLIAAHLSSLGIENFLVEVGGEIVVKGKKMPSGESLQIGIESPSDDLLNPFLITNSISLDSGAVTTSGSYRKFHEKDGKTITHIIDPETGHYLQSPIISVSVYAKDAITADGVDNALLLMSIQEAVKFVEDNGLGAYFIYRDSNGKVYTKKTSRFPALKSRS